MRLQNAITNKPTTTNEPTIQNRDVKIGKLKELLNNTETLKAFREIVDTVLNKRSIPDSKATDLMLRLNLVEKGKQDFYGNYNYTLTPLGQQLREMLIDFDLSKK